MASELEDLFNQILESEERTQEQKTRVNKLKSDLSSIHKKTKDCTDELKSYEGERVLKTQQLLDSTLHRQWLQTKLDILQKQQQSLSEELAVSQKKLVAVKLSLHTSQTTFCREVNEFSADYDLVSNGQCKRETTAKRDLQELLVQEKALQKDLSQLHACQNSVKKVQEEKFVREKQVFNRKEELQKLNHQLKAEKETVLSLQKEKERVSQYPQEDAEFKRLRNELDRRKKHPQN